MKMAVDKLIWKIVLDIFVLLCVCIPLLLLLTLGEPYRRGYFPGDQSLSLPLKPQQISEAMLAGLGFALVIVTIVIIEFLRDRKGNGIGEKFLSGCLLPGWVWESYVGIGVYTFGAACQQLTTNIAKYAIGRPRPHFFAVCQPIPVENSTLNALGFVQDFTCSGPDQSANKDSMLSFPSAHACYAMYTAVFVIMYLQIKAKWRGSKLLRHLLQYLIMIGAWYTVLSRYIDFYHHATDVLAGSLLGVAFGVLVFIYVLKPKKYGLPSQSPWPSNVQTTALPR